MRRRLLAAALISLASLGAAPARAEVGASGTRLSIAGAAPRSYMTYGHAEEPELYAPIVQELRRVGVVFLPAGDSYTVSVRGRKIGDWPIVRSRQEIPETGEEACVLVMGGSIYVPVRAVAKVASVSVRWDRKESVLALVPSERRAAPPAAARVEPGPAPQAVVLTGVEIVQKGGTVQVKVRSTGPVRTTSIPLQRLTPPRIAIDFDGARWQDGLQLPAGVGEISALRTGMFQGKSARLVLDLRSPELKLNALDVTKEEIRASVGLGTQVARATEDPEVAKALQELAIRQALSTRTGQGPTAIVRRGSRSGTPSLLDPNGTDASVDVVDPADQDPEPIYPDTPLPGRAARSLVGKVIVLDAGHGGHDSGALGLSHSEKNLTLQMTYALKQSLEARGATTIMTRSDDTFVSLEQRVGIANGSGADLFVSIHCNSCLKRNAGSGSQTYTRTPQSLQLARALHPRLVGAVQARNGGIHRERNFYVIRNTTMPSVLLEIAYINNTQEEIKLADPTFHRKLGESLAQGLLEYYGGE